MKKLLLILGLSVLTIFTSAQSYLPLTGGTLTGDLNIGNLSFSHTYNIISSNSQITLSPTTDLWLQIPSSHNGYFQYNGSNYITLNTNGITLGAALNGTAAAFSSSISSGNITTDGTYLMLKNSGNGGYGNTGLADNSSRYLFYYNWDATLGNYSYLQSSEGNSQIKLTQNNGIVFNNAIKGVNATFNGITTTKKLIVTQTGWSDYVYYKKNKLRPLLEVEQFIKVNKHLPDIPSAKEVAKEGVDVGATEALLLKKIEELTLYMIEMKKENEEMYKKILSQQNQINSLKKQVKQ